MAKQTDASAVEPTGGAADTGKWVLVVALVLGALAGFYYWSEQSQLLRVVGLLAALGIAGYIAFTTERGRFAWDFLKESRTEVRKVVWPTRQETTQTTLIVLAMVMVVALFLWLLDSVLGWIVRLLLGRGG